MKIFVSLIYKKELFIGGILGATPPKRGHLTQNNIPILLQGSNYKYIPNFIII